MNIQVQRAHQGTRFGSQEPQILHREGCAARCGGRPEEAPLGCFQGLTDAHPVRQQTTLLQKAQAERRSGMVVPL
jgi:hypothetical protein